MKALLANNRWRATLTLLSGLLVAGPVCAYEITDSFGKHRFDQPPQNVVVTDWALLEQMLELGVVPIGAPEVDNYRRLVVQPALPDSVKDIGLRISPSLKKVKGLTPELVILGTNQKDFARPFSLFTRVMYYKSFSDRYRTNGKKSRLRFLQIAELFQKTDLAEQKLAAMDARLAELKANIQQHFGGQPPLVTTLRFSSAEKALVYGHNSMPDHALQQLGLRSAVEVGKSQWGEKELSVKRLAELDSGYLLIFKPIVPFESVMQSPTWQQLPAVQQGRVLVVEPVWSYGGAMSIGYIADAVAEALLDLPATSAEPP